MTPHRYRLGTLIAGGLIALAVTTVHSPAANPDEVQATYRGAVRHRDNKLSPQRTPRLQRTLGSQFRRQSSSSSR
jgi:hypothetical protein